MSAVSAAAPEQKEMSEQAVVEAFNRLRQDQSTLMSRIAELESERHEHALVLETLGPMEANRKCHRLVGGALVERSVKEVMPEVQASCDNIDLVLKQFGEQLKRKDHELEAFSAKYKINMKGQGGQVADKKVSDEGTRGVLA